MLKCHDIGGLLLDYVDDALESSTKVELDEHLSDCPACVAFVNTYKQSVRLSRDLRCEDIPPELQRKLRSFIKEKLQQPPS